MVAGVVLVQQLAVDPRDRVVERRAGAAVVVARALEAVDPRTANLRTVGSWWLAITFTQNFPASRIAGHVSELLAGQTSSSGGSSDTDVSELADMPDRPRGCVRGDHRHAGRQMAEDVAEVIGLDLQCSSIL